MPNIPIAMITGTNGKTTTTRMLAHILTQGGFVVGFTSTDGIVIAGHTVCTEDSSGYEGARRVLHDPSVTAAVLKTARGDLLRYGLYTDRCDVAVLLNVRREHIGIDGVDTLEQMAEVKRCVVEAARKAVVLNADDPLCRQLIDNFPSRRTTLFTFERTNPAVKKHLRQGGKVFCVDGERTRIVSLEGDRAHPLVAVAGLPASWGGVLHYNIANAMAAAALADGLGIAEGVTRAALESFDISVEQSLGRFNILMRDPFLLIADRAISPPAAEAFVQCLAGLDVRGSRLCFCTTAGNRPDRHFREMGAWLAKGFDRFVCYDVPLFRRGRGPGEITFLLKSALVQHGVKADSVAVAPDFQTALACMTAQPRRGDLVVALGAFSRADIEALRAKFAPTASSRLAQ
ncbi:MAG TPA: Mur ligase family protein [Methyloceanibacter sp.]|nr:Mur ligase family protein [Methyloceanibacter sp.]